MTLWGVIWDSSHPWKDVIDLFEYPSAGEGKKEKGAKTTKSFLRDLHQRYYELYIAGKSKGWNGCDFCCILAYLFGDKCVKSQRKLKGDIELQGDYTRGALSLFWWYDDRVGEKGRNITIIEELDSHFMWEKVKEMTEAKMFL